MIKSYLHVAIFRLYLNTSQRINLASLGNLHSLDKSQRNFSKQSCNPSVFILTLCNGKTHSISPKLSWYHSTSITSLFSHAITMSKEITPPLDMESPYYLYPSHNSRLTLVSDVLTGLDDYNPWALAMTRALKGKNKFGFVDGSFPMPESTHADFSRWNHVNNIVMTWILNSIHRSLAHTVLYANSAATVWADLQTRFSTQSGTQIYELEKRIVTLQQQDHSISQYYNQLHCFWDELSLIDPPPA